MKPAIVFLYIISCKVVRFTFLYLNENTVVHNGSILKNTKNQNRIYIKRYKKLKFDLRKEKIIRKLMEMLFSQTKGFGLNMKGFIG